MIDTARTTTGFIEIARVQAYAFRAPIDTPVKTSFGTMHVRPAVIVRVEDRNGAHGWGEAWCNFPACGAEHRVHLIDTVIGPLLTGRCHAGPSAATEWLIAATRILAIQSGEVGPLHQAIAAIDIALWDLAARRAGHPLHHMVATPVFQVPVYASGIDPNVAPETIGRAREAGFTAFKVKIGFELERDLAAVKAAHAALEPDERLMLDVNQAWELQTARDMAAALVRFSPDWLEEPLATDRPVQEWRALAADVSIPLAAGENICGDDNFRAAIEGGYLAVVQPDVAKWGGFSGCLRIGREAIRQGLRYCPHFLGGGLGLMASAHLLAAVGGDGRLEVDVNPNPLRETLAIPFPKIYQGMLRLPQAPGLGVEPNLKVTRRWLTLETEHVNR
jgi:D-galactarolactone cycloisomerase